MANKPIFELTNIPKDINLTLSNGVLTLKSGSKLYIPNGVGVFDTITTSSDITRTQATGSDFFCYYKSGTIYLISPSSVGSGSTAPTGSTTMYWYDTTNNLAKRTSDSGSTWADGFTLPFARIKVSGGAISSIEQVFNGFGYVGSTFFALPGVSGYYPNGKNGFENKFETITLNFLLIRTFQNQRTSTNLGFTENSINYFSYGLEIVDKLPSLNEMVINKRYYSKFDNRVYYTSDGINISESNYVFFGNATTSASPYTITDFKVVNPFLVADIYEYEKARSLPLSQYANSPKYMGLFDNLSYIFNNSRTLEDWFNVVYNLKTASGYGLDIWGIILNQDRQFHYDENGTTQYIYLGGEQTIDGKIYSAEYMEEMYRMVLFLKALCCITNCTLASLNSLLQFYFNQRVYVINYGTMEIRYVFEFYVSKLEKAIFTTEFLPRPTGVLANFEYIPLGGYFGFFVNGVANPTDQPYAPFDNKPFYR